jgi:acetyltransferase-like isoleucine patch superfamily enzyme
MTMSTCKTIEDVNIGKDSFIAHPCEFENINNIRIGDGVRIREGGWLDCSTPEANIFIGEGCAIGRDNQLTTASSITLEPYVMTANNVHIATQTHNYEDVDIPISAQGSTDSGPITLGYGCWIGRNSLIFANIGRGSVVAGNSFVNKDVPDYCVVAGNPAKIIKRYNQETKTWERCV